MVYESSYSGGGKPFLPDTTRGNWAMPMDFVYACLTFALKLEIFSIGYYYFVESGASVILPYLICLGLIVVPLMVIQSFLGQFSSSGFISAFRVSPLFKGMGYISLGANICMLIYSSLFAAVPLLLFFNSFRPTLPWSCEARHWGDEISNTCHIPSLNDSSSSNGNDSESGYGSWYKTPALLFFQEYFDGVDFDEPFNTHFALPWQMVCCNYVAWGLLALIFYKFNNVEKIGMLIRYTVWSIIGVMIIVIIRLLFLPTAMNGIKTFLIPSLDGFIYALPTVPMFAMVAFGPGWGVIIALASHNKFKTNIMRYSWFISLGQLFIFYGLSLIVHIVHEHIEDLLPKNNESSYFNYVQHEWSLYLSTATALANMEWPNFWCLLYYGMLTMGAIISLVVQIHSILVSVFDEFEILRTRKMEVTYILLGVFALISTYFCSSDGVLYYSTLFLDSEFIKISMSLLLVLVVLWVYGRERFQRDIQFMLGQPFATWKVNMLRFVAPICMLLVLLLSIVAVIFEHYFTTAVVIAIGVICILLPWLFIPGYAIFGLIQTTGPLGTRFKRCCRPTDWYPVESEDRQRYEEFMGNMDITHQLKEVSEEVL